MLIIFNAFILKPNECINTKYVLLKLLYWIYSMNLENNINVQDIYIRMCVCVCGDGMLNPSPNQKQQTT